MKKIDRETVQRILDAADIVEVVSDFVSLKKRGANYIGLCPFHNERTPSFSVSKAKGICKCFSCGKGGSPLNFIMEHEQLSYYEALRYLAKKYNIEIRERELTETEIQESTERESLMAINDFALNHFEQNLTQTDDGRDIGLAYFRDRGINDLMIKRFRLGYSLDKPDALLKAALAKGFTEKYLLMSGLCNQSEKGGLYDKFRGRVMYPIFSVSGRVIAFGGRTLRSDKNVAKYMNSPESLVYKKSNELYGLYQAKSAIMKQDKCILVEGYMDVISMHQVGVENVVASSGTSLTDGQIRLIHRFTQNVTVIYDSDAAGIKASLRGIDMLLAEGLNIKVLLLPDGEDPDSFAQSHSTTEVEEYIAQNESDFIQFKTRILLADAGNDPIKRSQVITSILKSIAVIPDQVVRAVYLKECSRSLDIEEKVLSLQLSKYMADNAEKKAKSAELKAKQDSLESAENPSPTSVDPIIASPGGQTSSPTNDIALSKTNNKILNAELVLVKYIVKYGMLTLDGLDTTVLEFINNELANDEIELTDGVCRSILRDSMVIMQNSWAHDRAAHDQKIEDERQISLRHGQEEIRRTAKDLSEIESMEVLLNERCLQECEEKRRNYAMLYLEDYFLSTQNDDQRRLATILAADKYQLSRVHTKYSHVETEEEKLPELVYRAVMELKYTILDLQINELNTRIKSLTNSNEQEARRLMTEIFEMYKLKSQFAKILGERIVNPK